MKDRIRKHLSFSNVVAGLALFIALGGSAYAVGKNTVGTKQIKNNAVTAKKIKKNAVVTAKIKNNAVTASKIKNGSVTDSKIPAGAISGSKINLATLGQVPSAANAANADVATQANKLNGQESVLVKLGAGETKTIASNGQVSLVATCTVNDEGDDYVDVFGKTTVNGAVFAGNSNLDGSSAADSLNTDTPAEDANFASMSTGVTGQTTVSTDIDAGFILGPDGKGIVANTEGLIVGVNYLGSPCIVGGVFNYIG